MLILYVYKRVYIRSPGLQPETCEVVNGDPAGCTWRNIAACDEPHALSSSSLNMDLPVHE